MIVIEFSELKIKQINRIVKYTPSLNAFISRNKTEHIIGIELGGVAEHDFGFQKIIFKKDMVYFLNRDEDYDVRIFEKGASYSVHFTTYEPIDTHSFAFTISNPQEIINLIKNIENNSNGNECFAMSGLYKLCGLYDDYYRKKYITKGERSVEVKEYIDTHFKDKTCLSDAVEVCGVSTRHFNNLFKAWFNITPNRYIISKRVELAKQLLSTLPISVKETSETCGFSDVYYFSKVFKSHTGISPASYRKDFKK